MWNGVIEGRGKGRCEDLSCGSDWLLARSPFARIGRAPGSLIDFDESTGRVRILPQGSKAVEVIATLKLDSPI